MKKISQRLLVFVIGFAVIIGIFFGIACLTTKKFEKGCECGGHWEYQEAVGHYRATTYIYKCDRCGNIEEFSYHYNDKK